MPKGPTAMNRIYTPKELLSRLRDLPDDMPISNMIPPPRSYDNHKHHCLCWMMEMSGAGYYGRTQPVTDAAAVYNRLQCVGMVIWLAESAGIPANTVRHAALRAARSSGNVARQTAAARQLLPWVMVAKALWPAK